MNTFTKSIRQAFQGVFKAFQTFPASIGCALAFAVVTAIRIQLDWPQQEPLNFLFNCLHWAFAVGVVFSLAAITIAQSRYNNDRAFLISNILGAGAAALTFLLMYNFGGTDPAAEGYRYAMVSGLAPEERWARIVDTITDPDRLVMRAWTGDGHGGQSMEKWMRQVREGYYEVDWDVEIQVVLAQRQDARARKDLAEADAIRDGLDRIGIRVEDTPQGVRWSLDD